MKDIPKIELANILFQLLNNEKVKAKHFIAINPAHTESRMHDMFVYQAALRDFYNAAVNND